MAEVTNALLAAILFRFWISGEARQLLNDAKKSAQPLDGPNFSATDEVNARPSVDRLYRQF